MRLLFLLTALVLYSSSNAEHLNIVAHRGASYDAPENTLPAFKLAWEQGADAIEGDFHITKDGYIVCIHDKDTRKVGKTKLMVRDSTFAELRKLDVGLWKGEVFKGTRIPTIAEVFSTIPSQKRIFIEIKCGPEIIPQLVKEIDQSGLQLSQIVVICFDAKVLKELKEQAPELKVSWLSSFKKDKVSGKMVPSLTDVFQTLEWVGAEGFSSSSAIPEEYVNPVKSRGYEWHVWTVNDLEKAGQMKELGVQSITTDRPGYLREHIVEKGSSGQ
jgi:glycerophosphoryl diester phosphodiesterase